MTAWAPTLPTDPSPEQEAAYRDRLDRLVAAQRHASTHAPGRRCCAACCDCGGATCDVGDCGFALDDADAARDCHEANGHGCRDHERGCCD